MRSIYGWTSPRVTNYACSVTTCLARSCGVRQVAGCDRILSRLANVTGIDSLFHATLTPTANCLTQSWHPHPFLNVEPIFVFRKLVDVTLHSARFAHVKKGKAAPLQAWSGPEGFRKLRFPHFMTTAQDDGKIVSLTHQPPLTAENTPGTNFW